jgi:hypothetical protein
MSSRAKWSTISELGSFIAREQAAATPVLPPGAVVRAPIVAANGATNAS